MRRGGAALGNRVLVAGGGGGAYYDPGGSGGGLVGGDGYVATGGSQTAGGIGYYANDGSLGQGGGGGAGGGGGGHYGGGGSYDAGAGGSSYTEPAAERVEHRQGVHAGDGVVRLLPNPLFLSSLIVDAGQILNLPDQRDNLGNHTATQPLALAGHELQLSPTEGQAHALRWEPNPDGP